MKRPIGRRKYHKQRLVNLLPIEQIPTMQGDIGQLRHEVHGLRAENESLLPMKAEAARLRAAMADLFFTNSEKCA